MASTTDTYEDLVSTTDLLPLTSLANPPFPIPLVLNGDQHAWQAVA